MGWLVVVGCRDVGCRDSYWSFDATTPHPAAPSAHHLHRRHSLTRVQPYPKNNYYISIFVTIIAITTRLRVPKGTFSPWINLPERSDTLPYCSIVPRLLYTLIFTAFFSRRFRVTHGTRYTRFLI